MEVKQTMYNFIYFSRDKQINKQCYSKGGGITTPLTPPLDPALSPGSPYNIIDSGCTQI